MSPVQGVSSRVKMLLALKWVKSNFKFLALLSSPCDSPITWGLSFVFKTCKSEFWKKGNNW